MEYRRARRPSARRRQGGMAPAAIIVCIVFLSGVYLFGISKLGTWLAERVVAPVIQAMLPIDRVEEPTLIQTIQPSPEPVDERVCELPNLDCYAIQIGVYADTANAEAQAARLRSLGAAGYLVGDGDRTRVLAAGYPLVTSMQQVCGQLEQEGVDCLAYEIHTDGVRFSASGTLVQLNTLEAVLNEACSLPEELSAFSIRFDKESMTVAAGIEALQRMQRDAESQLTSLRALESAAFSDAIEPLLSYFASANERITALCADFDQSVTVLSASLKHQYLDCVYAYADLVTAMAEG